MKKISKRELLPLLLTFATDALDNILGFFGCKTSRKRNAGYADVGKTIGAMTDFTGEMHVTLAMAGVVDMADAILLRAGTIVNLMEQMGTGEHVQRAEKGGTVNRGKLSLKVGEAEGIGKAMPHLLPYHQADGGQTDAGIQE